MIDRHGQSIRVGFQPHELEYIAAAMTLPLRERESSYAEIGEITGRTVKSIKNRARLLLTEEKKKARAFLEVALRKQWATTGAARPRENIGVDKKPVSLPPHSPCAEVCA